MTEPVRPAGSILGNSVQRKEDPALLVGERQFFADMTAPNTAHMVFVRSTIAHADIIELDIIEAAAMPGVIAVHTAETLDIVDEPHHPAVSVAIDRPHLARGRVRFVGDIVAVVVAETEAQAVDASEMVFVDYEPLEAVIDVEAAAAPDAPLLWPELGTNVVFTTTSNFDDDVLAGAHTVVRERIVSQRLAGVPMEPLGCFAVPDDDRLTLWIPSQNPVAIAGQIATMIGIDAERLRVAAPAVGGGFGSKAGYYGEYGLAGRLALDLGRPVKWVSTRSEDMVALNHGRGQVLYAELGLDATGRIVGLRADCLGDIGAYGGMGGLLTTFTQLMMHGPYQIAKVGFRGRGVTTNTTRIGAYRGAGRPEATQTIERMMDLAALELGMDPVEIRRLNLLPTDAFPHLTSTGANYDVGEYHLTLDTALRNADYEALRVEQRARRGRSDVRQLGIGVSCYVEVTAPPGLFSEWGRVQINDDGTATMAVGTSSHGQGHDTSFSMVVSDVLGIPIDRITLHQSDTATVKQGIGTMGSRSLQAGGSALQEAAKVVLAQAQDLAAHLLEADPADIIPGPDGLQVAGVPTTIITWSEVVAASNDPTRRPDHLGPGLGHELNFATEGPSFPFGSHVAVVEVDTATGEVELLRHVAVDDCGRILNPMLVRGQQHGGIAQGVAQALYEGVRYDEDANPMSTTLMDYLVPAATELVSFDATNTETPTPRNPLGAKGIGESGTIGSTPAIQSAVLDAVSHLGIRHLDMPLSPERIWRAITTTASGDAGHAGGAIDAGV